MYFKGKPKIKEQNYIKRHYGDKERESTVRVQTQLNMPQPNRRTVLVSFL